MKKHFLSVAMLLIASNALFSQVETFDLSNFKLPYLKYQSLNLTFNANNQNEFQNWKDTSDYKLNINSIYSNLDGTGSYYSFINTPSEQSGYSIMSSFSFQPFNGNKRIFDDETSQLASSQYFNLGIYANSRNRFFTGNKFFIEVGPSLGVNFYNSSNKNKDKEEDGNVTYEYINKWNENIIQTNIEFGGGYGRMEVVTDAQMALFILKDLKKENRLKREPTHEEIFKLAELISQKRNQRFFDSRQKVIDQIKAIDSFLTSAGLTEVTDATYFTTIYDNWLYTNNHSRQSGFRISGGPRVGYSIYQTKNKWEQTQPTQSNGDSKSLTAEFAYGFWLNMVDEKPLNHFWQRSLSANMRYIFTNSTRTLNGDPKSKRLHDNFELNLSASLGYYPTTRTYINFGIGSGMRINKMDKYYYLADTEYNDNRFRYLAIFVGPSANGYYYFSPKLRLSFEGNIFYNFYNTDNKGLISPPFGFGFNYFKFNRFNTYLVASLSYAIF
jgi:hypothetical protein